MTWLGWLLGIPCVTLLAFAGEAVGIGGTQVLVGAGMGMGVGLLQGRALRRLGMPSTPWFWACFVGLAIPFLGWDIAARLGTSLHYSLPFCVALGGVLAGCWQAMLLRGRFSGPGWWALASAIGWGLAGAMASSADVLLRNHAIRGLAGAGLYLGLIGLGGAVLGAVTGAALTQRWRAVPG